MLSQYQKVKEFMTLFKQECPDKIGVPSLEVCSLRAKLIMEEACESIRALGFNYDFRMGVFVLIDAITPNLVEILDGLCDLHYVGFLGTAIACGIPEENLNAAFDEVHRSNMSKMWKVGEIEEAKRKYPDGQVEYYGLGLYRIIDKDGKTIKSPSYSPAQLEQFLVNYKQNPEWEKATHEFLKIEHKEIKIGPPPKQTCLICGESNHPTERCDHLTC